MAFMMKKKKYKFNVEVHLEELVEVALVNEVLFAKIRLLDGGSFVEYSTREEVKNHTVKWNQKFEILCKMSANASTGVLDPCSLRISIRKEMKGGRSYYKLGFIDINLSEYAGSGEISRRFLLEGYDHRHRLDNSMLLVSLKMHMLSGDILFKAPSPASKERTKDGVVVNNEDGKTPQEDSPLEGVSPIISSTGCPGAGTGSINISGGGIGSRPISSSRDDIISQSQTSSGFGSLTKKKPDYFTSEIDPNALIASIVTDSGLSESSEPTIGSDSFPSYPPTSLTSLTSNAQQVVLPSCVGSGGIGGTGGSGGGGSSSGTGGGGGNISQVGVMEMGHSRNSSNTSQMSKGSGYSSFSHSQHSRQSSEGDSGHARFQKSLSLLSKLNQRAIHTAMKLNIPSLLNSNNNSSMMSIMINNCNNNDQNIKKMTTTSMSTSTITTPTPSTTTIDNDGSVYLTPNSSLIVTEQNSEEFCTPLNETPNRIIDQLTLPSPLRRSRKIHNDDVIDNPEDNDVIDGLDDTSLHSPRIPKMKSLEDLNVLDIQFQRATIKQRLLNHQQQQQQQQQQQHYTQQLDLQQQQHQHHHQPLSLLNHPMIGKLQNYELYNAAAVTGVPGKIRSLNNLVFDNVDNEREQRVAELRKEFENLKNDTTQFKKPKTISSSSSYHRSSSKINGKFNNNNRNKIGITKFIGDDDTESRYNHYPITKIKSMGTIPDIITDPIRYEPFLTPITNRKNTLSLGGDINEISDNNKKFKFNRMSSAESDDGSSSEIESYDYPTFNLIRSKPSSSSSSSISYDRGFRSRYDYPERSSSGTNFTRNSLGCRNVNSNCIKNVNYCSSGGGGGGVVSGGVCNGAGVGVRQSDGIIYYNDGRTRSITTNVQEIMSNRSISGVPRRLLDGSGAVHVSSSIAIGGGGGMGSGSGGAAGATVGTGNNSNNSGNSCCNSNSGNNSGSGTGTTATIVFTCTTTSNDNNNQLLPSVVSGPALTGNSGGGGSSVTTDTESVKSNPSPATSLLMITSSGSNGAAISGGGIGGTDSQLSPMTPSAQQIRRPSFNMNPSSGSLVISETGSLDRMKTAAEKRKKGGVSALDDTPTVSDRVEETRVNPDSLIDEILKDTKLDQLKETTEPSGLQLYIARDGTASLGSHRVKSHVTAGAIKQVVMENPR